MTGAPISRPVSDESRDDIALPYAVEALDVRGRVVRLGASVDAILSRHGYPPPVARLLGEALALTALLGSSLKFEGGLQLQTRSDGIVDLMVVDFDAPDRLRAFARFDAQRLEAAGAATPAALLGRGSLAFTIDGGQSPTRHQGVVALSGQGLEAAAHEYFRQSEQIPTLARLAVGEHVSSEGKSWRAGGLLAQHLPAAPRRARDFDPGDAPPGADIARDEDVEEDAWAEAKALGATVEDHELIDPTLSAERLLYRLFNERGVRVFDPKSLREACRCSTERIEAMLRSFTPLERADMVGDDGRIGVTCEFCSTHRSFDPAAFDASAADGDAA